MTPLVIAQLTDPHLGFGPGGANEPNARRFAAALAHVAALRPTPDALFVTGDLTEHGDAASYALLRELLAAAPCPVHLLLGNHDRRDAFAAAFPETPLADGFVQYAVELPGLRCLALDTLEPARHGGGFCAARAAWLSRTLAAAPDRPTLVLLHHPPAPIGIAWMDPSPAAPWIGRLGDALAGRPQVLALAAGHLHRPATVMWRGLPVTIAAATSPELALDLTAIDPDRPDGRAMIVAGPPGFALHRWDGRSLVTHHGWTTGDPVAWYGPDFQPLVRQLAAERGAR